MNNIKYTVDDDSLSAAEFVDFAVKVWPGSYDPEKTAAALSATLNITARSEGSLVGCLRILTDGYYFATITEILVLPRFQGQGIGSRLLKLAKEFSPASLYFGAQPGKEPFYEKNGFEKGIQSYTFRKENKSALSSAFIYYVY